MKFFFSLLTGFFLCVSSFGQSADNYSIYPNQIKRFLKPAKILNKSIDLHGNGYVEFTNAKNQILRFRLRNNKLQQGSCNIAFEIYYYENNYLKRIESLDRNGNLIECNLKLNNEAVIEYTIEKPELYLKKKKRIDDAEGNINMEDDSKEKIIRVRYFNAKNIPIIQSEPTYTSSKSYWEQNIRMAWP